LARICPKGSGAGPLLFFGCGIGWEPDDRKHRARAVTRPVHALRVDVTSFDPAYLLRALGSGLAGHSEERQHEKKA